LYLRDQASPVAATLLRHNLVSWVHDAGVLPDIAQDIVLSAYEAMANTVRHAYPDNTVGPLELRAEIHGNVLSVTVTDHGRWRPPGPHVHSPCHGLPMIHALCQRVIWVRGPNGTTVHMTWYQIG